MSRIDTILEFVDSLARAEMPSERLVNIYREPTRQRNLIRWLDRALGCEPSFLFVGEAPGKNGAAVTGVPFSSVKTLGEIDALHRSSFAEDCCFEFPSNEVSATTESTATNFWNTLNEHLQGAPLPLTWNAIPFWPVENQTPTANEIKFGSQWLSEIVEMYPSAMPIAVGRRAEVALNDQGIRHFAVRHPSHGGKLEFAAGVELIAQSLFPKRTSS